MLSLLLNNLSRQASCQKNIKKEKMSKPDRVIQLLLAIPLFIFSLFAAIASVYIFFDSIKEEEFTFLLLVGLLLLGTVGAAGLSAAFRLFSGRPRNIVGGLFSLFFLRFFGILFLLAPLLISISKGTYWLYTDYSIMLGLGCLGLAAHRKKVIKKKKSSPQ